MNREKFQLEFGVDDQFIYMGDIGTENVNDRYVGTILFVDYMTESHVSLSCRSRSSDKRWGLYYPYGMLDKVLVPK